MSKPAIPTGLNFWLSLPDIINILKKEINDMGVNLADLQAKVDAIAVIVPELAADYATLKAEIAALTGQIDPTLQSKLDALTVKLGNSLASLTVLDNSVVQPVVPPTP